jgi:dTDP-4-dehydrorhamnose 3,5-epimerase
MAEPVEVGIAGVLLFPLVAHTDDRGSVTEVYRRQWIPEGREGVQANLSMSRPKVLRGLHFHRKQSDYWCVLVGTAFIGLFDLRAGSPTEGKKAEIRVDVEDRRQAIHIPRGVAHGYFAETAVLLEYLVDEYYEGGDEFGLAWDDLAVGIEWPSREPILSDRDRSNPGLAEVLRDPPRYGP